MSDNPPIQPKPPIGSIPTPPAPPPEDTGSQALSEALQSSFFLVKVMMFLLVCVFIGSGFFIVESGQQAIILRFGKPVGEGEKALLGPGAHWAFPAPIDEVEKVSLGKRQEASSTIGLPLDPNGQPEEPPAQPKDRLNPAGDGYMLTADANIIHARVTVYYRVTDPVRYIFGFTNAAQFVTNALNNALLYASSRFNVDDVLLNKKAAFNECVERRARELIDHEQLGITVEQLNANPYPPGQLRGAFAAVTSASANRSQTNDQAVSYKTEKLSKALADAHSCTNSALDQSTNYVGLAKAEAQQFSDLLEKYKEDPELYFQLRQSEVVGQVLAHVKEKIYISKRADGKPRELRLQLNREPDAPPPPAE